MAKSAAPLLIAAGAAYLLIGGKKKKKKSSCPPVVHLDWASMPIETIEVQFDDQTSGEVKLPKTAFSEAIGGNRDILDITGKVLAPYLPENCITSDKVKINLISSDGETLTYSAVGFFFALAADLLESFYHAGLFGEDELQFSTNELTKWWVSNMGEAPLPKN